MTDFADLNTVKKLVKEAQDADQDNRQQARDAHLFVSKIDGQWEPYWWTQNENKPRYTFDQTSPIIDQVAGEIEEADFDIQCKPSGGNATKELAQLRDGMIRNIEAMSDAQDVYATAARNIVTAGIDHWLVKTDFVNDDSFDQDLVVEPIFNSIDRVWFDLASQRRDRSDSNWGVLMSAIPKSTYDERWKERAGQSVSQDKSCDAYIDKADQVIIANFFYRKWETRTLVKTNLGRVFEEDEFNQKKDELAAGGETVTSERKVKNSTFYVRKYDGEGWMEEEQKTVFSTVPLVPVYANYKVIENKPIYHGVVLKAMDPQRVLNYSLSREIEEGALAPRTKYWMTEAQAKGHTSELATLNTNSDPVQFYNHEELVPPPAQQGGAAINPGLQTISTNMQQIMGRTAGIFAAGMGDNPGLQSGVAIEKLQRKGNNVTVKYFKAMERGIRRTAQLLNEGMRGVYDTARQVRILNQDGSFDMTELNEIVEDEDGNKQTLNDLTVGKYDFTCKSGPSFDSQQDETVSALLEIAGFAPEILQLGSDILLGNISAPGVDKIAERSRKQLLTSGVIPEEQMSDEEKQEIALIKQQQGQQPDPNMLIAEAENKKGEAELAKAQVSLMKLQSAVQNDQQKIAIAAQKLQLDGREQDMKLAEKLAGFDRDTQQQKFDQTMALREQQRQTINDAVDNLNTQADTLGKIRAAMGVDSIVGPGNQAAYIEQSREVLKAQEQT